ncbi:MAG: histidinol-phosphate transaminase [Gammaproteobacteria bacterium]
MTCDFSNLAVAGVQRLKPYEPGKPIETLERELGIRDSLKLASNENPLGPSPRAIEAMRRELDKVSVYPDGNGFALKAALAKHYGVPAECVTLGNGSNEILELVARAFLRPGLNAVFSRHAFAVYPIVVQAVGATARVAPPNAPDAPMPFGHELAAFAKLIDHETRVVFIANPNNPTGTWIRAERLHAFLQAVPAATLVVVDEAYFEYVQAPGYPNAVPWLSQFPNLIVTRTFSKIYGLAGLRIGYGLSHRTVAELLNRVRQPFNTSSVAQAAALAALEDHDHVTHSRAMNSAGLAQFARAFEARGLSFIPSVANFICVNVGREASPVYQALLREGVIVRPVASYELPEYLRITVGREDQNGRVIGALDKVLGL